MRYLGLIGIICFGLSSRLQASVLEITFADTKSKPIYFIFDTLPQAQSLLYTEVYRYRNKGFLATSLDTLFWHNDTLSAQFYLGDQFEERFYSAQKKKKSKGATLESVLDDSITFWSDNGYPFAMVNAEVASLQKDTIKYKISTAKGNLVVVDSIRQQGKRLLSDKFLLPYLSIHKGEVYNSSKIAEIDKLINRLPYVQTSAPSQVFLTSEKVRIDLFLQKKKTNQFDFILGILPKNEFTGKILVTGEAKLLLNNAFKRGEAIHLQWKRLQKNTQTLRLDFSFPYILQTPLGIGGNFYLDRRDSSWVNLRWQLRIPTQINSNSKIEAIVEGQQTIALNVDTNYVKLYKKLPSIHQSSLLLYGLQYQYYDIDNFLLPQKGFRATIKFQMGTRNIKPSTKILSLQDVSGFSYATIYDSINNNKLNINTEWSLEYYWNIHKSSVIKFADFGKIIYNKSLLRNEMYRVGGATLLRGFDEEAFLASVYNVSTIEYRYLVQKNSYLYVFTDIGVLHRVENNIPYKNVPIGFGAGMSFESKAGIFALSYAMGKATGQALDFRSGKIHISYITVF